MTEMDDRLKKLEMTHLPMSDLKAQVASSMDEKPPEDPKRLARLNARYTFRFDFTAKNGKRWEGTFTSVIPTIKTRQMIGVLRSQMGGGAPIGSLDNYVDNLNYAVAHLTFMLDETAPDFPEWANDLRNLDDPSVVFALWNTEVQPHEAMFLGRE